MHESEKWKWSRSVVSDSSRPHGLRPTRLLRPWNFPGKSTWVGCHLLLHKEGSVSKNWYFQIVVLEKVVESPLDCKEIKPVNPKGNQQWIFIGRTDAEAPILWPPEAKKWLIRKDWCWERLRLEKGATEDEMVGWHHRLNGHEFEQTSRDSEGQGRLACWVHGFAKSWTQLSN